MSTKSMRADEKSEGTESPEGRNDPTLVQSQPQEVSAKPKPQGGKKITPVMTEEQVSNLLARLQDVLSLWEGSENKMVDGILLIALPVPAVMTIEKYTAKNGHDKVFSVNGRPVVSVD